MNKKQRLTIGDMVDYKGNLYRALGESNEAKNSVIVMRTKQKLEPPYQEQGIDMRAADLNQDEGMNTSSSAPLSADSLRELDKILGRHTVHFNYSKAETRVKLLELIAAALQAERQQILEALEAQVVGKAVGVPVVRLEAVRTALTTEADSGQTDMEGRQ